MTKIVYAGRASHASVFTDDPQPREKSARLLWAVRHALAGLAVCITGIVPGYKGHQAEDAAERHGARTTKNVSSRTALLVIGHNKEARL